MLRYRRLTTFEGTYSQRKEERERLATLHAAQQAEQNSKNRAHSRKAARSLRQEERRRLARIQELENKIAIMEKELSQLGFRLENPPPEPGKVAKMGREYAHLQYEMDLLINEWEGLQTER